MESQRFVCVYSPFCLLSSSHLALQNGGILKEAVCLELAISETTVPNMTPQE
ncbi:hypothetical protein HPB52_000142 [Rhipicephalus sanguineus]|uniref:Uncharacterized protein n=1 Tax=Rhipicephalus sanguineus TaxID=34632 RepID=A0A9D4Q3Z8_RHISA|nr:hypothetical protein HPB52_000142 [Rhipicephalus sanguineus]